MIHSVKSFLAALGLMGGLLVPLAAQEIQRYRGTVGRNAAEFSLSWEGDGRVTGSYFCPEGKRILYRLEGHNPEEGVLEMDELTRGELTARLFLKKKIEGGQIVWSGVLANLDERELAVSFSRDREGNPEIPKKDAQQGGMKPPATGPKATRIPPSWERVSVPVRAETHWEFPADAPNFVMMERFHRRHRFSRMVDASSRLPAPPNAPGVHYLRAKVTGVAHADGSLRIALSLQPVESELTSKVFEPSIAEVALQAKYPERPGFVKAGKSCRVWFDDNGEISRLDLGGVLVTHVRNGADGMAEIRYLDDDADVGEELKAADLTEARLKTCIPDKLTAEGIRWRVMTFDRRLGLTVCADDGGRAALRMDGVASPAAAASAAHGKPWIFLGEAKAMKAFNLPQCQWGYDAE